MVHTAITRNNMDKMKFVYQCAHQVRGSIDNFTITNCSSVDDVSVELYTLICWIMVGPVGELENKARTNCS